MKKKHYLLFLLASLFLLTDVVWAQTSATVNGVVIDENGETLPGVSVVEVGTTNGVLTDLNGHYTLKTTSAKPSVSFSYIGYQTTTLPLNGRTKLDVQMKVETKVLDEVVVVGYGVQKKVNLTGSVTSINFADQTEGRPIMSVSSALSGLAAGMNVTQASGQPGSDGATIRVRGNGTFNTNSPLVLGGRYRMEHGQCEPQRHRKHLRTERRCLHSYLWYARRQRSHPYHHQKRERQTANLLFLFGSCADALQ